MAHTSFAGECPSWSAFFGRYEGFSTRCAWRQTPHPVRDATAYFRESPECELRLIGFLESWTSALRSSKKFATQKRPQAHTLVRSLLRRMSHTGNAAGHLRLYDALWPLIRTLPRPANRLRR